MQAPDPSRDVPVASAAESTVRELALLVLRASDRLEASRLPTFPPWRWRVGLWEGQLPGVEAILDFVAAVYKSTDLRTYPCLQMTMTVIKRDFRKTVIWISDAYRSPRPTWFPRNPRREKNLRIERAIATFRIPRTPDPRALEQQLAAFMLCAEFVRKPECQHLRSRPRKKGHRRDWDATMRAMSSADRLPLWLSAGGIRELCRAYFQPPEGMLREYTVPPTLRETTALRTGWVLATNLFLHHGSARQFESYLAVTQRSILRELVREVGLEPILPDALRPPDVAEMENVRDPADWDPYDPKTGAPRAHVTPAEVRLAEVHHHDPTIGKRAYDAARRGLLQRVDGRSGGKARVKVDGASYATWARRQDLREHRREVRARLLPHVKRLGKTAPDAWLRRTTAALRSHPERALSRLRRSFHLEGVSEDDQQEFLDLLAALVGNLAEEQRLGQQ